MLLFFDTETTGLPDNRLPLDHASQPHLVQIAALCMTPDGKEESMMNVLIEPNGYSIPEGAARIHGISTEKAKAFGVPLLVGVSMLSNLIVKCETIVAHNISFDLTLLRIALMRLKRPDRSVEKQQFCTMEKAKPICQMPGSARMKAAGMRGMKPPKLIEAYEFAFKEKFDNAHDALADVRACARLYFWLIEQQQLQIPDR